MINEYWLIYKVEKQDDDWIPVGQIMLKGSYNECVEMAKKYNFKSFELVKMKIINERFVKEEK